ncbi:MAG: DUF3169 family protein [Lachnospiraceae bacterium]|nr:DUF3169 family protein [Lachnospiraceae bacterium]
MNKKQNIKIYFTFAVLMIFCLVAGFFVGKFARNIQDTIDGINWCLVAENIYIPTSIFFVVLTFITYGISFFIYISAKKKYIKLEKMDDETFESEIDHVELALSKSMIISAVMYLFSLCAFPIVVLCREAVEISGKELSLTGVIIAEICFMFGMALFLIINALIVNLEKKINPEKQGNIFDIHFRKKWINCMDEAELMKAAKGAQKAYSAGMLTGMILWVIAFVLMLTLHTGILPIICIMIMMIVMLLVGEMNSR